MLKKIREMQDDKGFTLIELMVVVLIIAILLAIAIPTFLRVRTNSQDRAAQSSVSDALKAEKAFYTEGNEAYTADAAELEDIEASINYDTGGAGATCTLSAPAAGEDQAKCVQVSLVGAPDADQGVLLVAEAESGTFWAIRDVASTSGGTVGTFYNQEGSASAAAAATDAVDENW